jgi:hypothetical protein
MYHVINISSMIILSYNKIGMYSASCGGYGSCLSFERGIRKGWRGHTPLTAEEPAEDKLGLLDETWSGLSKRTKTLVQFLGTIRCIEESGNKNKITGLPSVQEHFHIVNASP